MNDNSLLNQIVKGLNLKPNIRPVVSGPYLRLHRDENNFGKGIIIRLVMNHEYQGKFARIIIRYCGSTEVGIRTKYYHSSHALYHNFKEVNVEDIINHLKGRRELKPYINV